MYAVIATGGKQYRVAAGDKVRVELLPAEVGASVDFSEVMLLANGDNIKVGTPFVAGSTVSAIVKAHGRGEKIRIVKHRRRKHHHKEAGHRQYFTELEITNISGG
ncbi:MAG: 50S ribosomal protein L21 [Gammaproteobacteria bacterium]|nr:50S ribosomal protein L21 [Gammaproteobacteria bacterium]